MRLPFSLEEFLDAFRAYNAAIGVAPLLLIALAVGLVGLANSHYPWRHRAIAAGLAVLWLWSGVVYQWLFFSRINAAARVFGAVFVVQGAMLLAFGVIGGRLQFAPRPSGATIVGWILVAYALVAYPLLGMALGHGYPHGPTFGAPCPMTIYSIGLLFWLSGRIPVTLAIIPVAWAAIGSTAAVQLGMREDFGLAVSAVLVVGEIIEQRWSRHAMHHRQSGPIGAGAGPMRRS